MKKLLFCSFALALASVSSARADVTGSGAGFAVPDNSPAGITSTIVIGPSEVITGNALFTLRGMTQTWIGDFTATITAPDLTSTTLFFKVGDITGTGFGDSSDLGGDYSFFDAAGGDLWASATAAGAAVVVPAGSYRSTAALSGAFTSLDSFFAGKNTAGTWTLTMSDRATGDTGGISGWDLSFSSTAIPEPTLIVLLAGLGLAGLARRRRS